MSRASLLIAIVAAVALLRCTPATQPAPRAAVEPLSSNVYHARVNTSKGAFVIEVHRDWAPLAADRFHELVSANFYAEARFYRVVKGFVAQFGMNADPAVHQSWQEKKLRDEPARTSNKRGRVCFTSSAAANSRTTHVFINLADNDFLDASSAPFGFVSSGMDVVDSLYDGYGENAPVGTGPEQSRLWQEGNRYLLSDFPRLDYIVDVRIEPPAGAR